MDAATWVALALGLGSLCLTLVLDKRNRAERVALDRAERTERLAREQREVSERDRTRWLEDRKSAYFAYLDAIEARASRLHMLFMGISHGYDSNSDAGDVTDSSVQARQLELMAPGPIADNVPRIEMLLKSAEWAAQIRSLDVTESLADAADPDQHPAAHMKEEIEEIASEINGLRSAMRADLGIS